MMYYHTSIIETQSEVCSRAKVKDTGLFRDTQSVLGNNPFIWPSACNTSWTPLGGGHHSYCKLFWHVCAGFPSPWCSMSSHSQEKIPLSLCAAFLRTPVPFPAGLLLFSLFGQSPSVKQVRDDKRSCASGAPCALGARLRRTQERHPSSRQWRTVVNQSLANFPALSLRFIRGENLGV